MDVFRSLSNKDLWGSMLLQFTSYHMARYPRNNSRHM